MNRAEMITEAVRLSERIDAGVSELSKAARATAEAERDYRKAKAVAWMQVEGTAGERAALVDAATADLRFARDVSDAGRLSALEALRSRRQQLSMLQTLVAAERVEMEHSRYGPEVGP